MFGGPSGRLPSSTSSHNFAQVPRANIQRSAFDRSFTLKTTCQASGLVPIYLEQDVLPGDTFALNSTIFARMSTPLVPAMDNIELTTQYFFVPNRLLWTNWEKFMGSQDNPGDSISYTIPQSSGGAGTTYAAMTLGDYFGLGNLGGTGVSSVGGSAGKCSALPFRAYNLIWNAWYRDENLQNSVVVDVDDGPDSPADYALLIRGRKKDYFYGALPFAQKGTAVTMPLGTSAPVYGQTMTATANQMLFQGWNTTDGDRPYGTIIKTPAAFTTSLNTPWTGVAAGDAVTQGLSLATPADYTAAGANFAPPYADLASAVAPTIAAVRLAFQTQKFLERDARGGTRYTELILSHFGVVNPDFRLQRPEYLGGGVSDINSTPVPQTTPTGIAGTTTKFGDLSAFSTALSNRNGFTKSFTEHGIIIGLLNIRLKSPTYQNGLHKSWTRQTRYDYYWPVFAGLGEQAVTQGEIFYLGDAAGANLDAGVWGYQERYGEYRYNQSMVTGLFKSNATGTLDIWHYAEDYGSTPTLNSTFLPDPTLNIIDRNLALTHSATVSQFKVDVFHKLHCARPMPVFGVPGNMDRF